MPAGGDQTLELLPHQVDAVRFCVEVTHSLLVHDSGVGATNAAAGLIHTLVESADIAGGGAGGSVLWLTHPRLVTQTVQLLRGRLPDLMVRRAGLVPTETQCVEVLSMRALVKRPLFRGRPYGLVVVDEFHLAGAGDAVATAAAAATQAAARVVGITPYLWQRHPVELYRMLQVIRPLGLPGRIDYNQSYVEYTEGHAGDLGYWHNPKPLALKAGTSPQLLELLRPFTHRCTQDDVAEALPVLEHQTEWLAISGEQRKAYDEAARAGRMLPWKREKLLDDVCRFDAVHSVKEQRTRALVRARPSGSKTLVLTRTADEASAVGFAMDDARRGCVNLTGASEAQQRRLIEQFRNDPSVPVLIADVLSQAGLEGLQVADLVINFGVLSLAEEEKLAGRVRRLGSRHPKVTYRTLLTDTEHEHFKAIDQEDRDRDQRLILGGLALHPTTRQD